MRTEQKTEISYERLSSEDVEAIRRQFEPLEGRLDGSATLSDVAEILEVPPEEVRRHLDRIRQERALRPATPRRRDQRALLAFAVVLLGAAFFIHRLNPRPLTPEERLSQMEEALNDMNAERRRHPVVRYPILKKVAVGALPPSGFNIEFRGLLTTTTAETSAKGPLFDRTTTEETLRKSIENVYQVAAEAENAAPKPKKPLPPRPDRNWGSPMPDTAMTYSISPQGVVFGDMFETVPKGGLTREAFDASVKEKIAGIAAGRVDQAVRAQEASLQKEPFQKQTNLQLPAGFTVQLNGNPMPISTTTCPLLVLPVDAERTAQKLEWVIRTLVWREELTSNFNAYLPSAAIAKSRKPYTEISVEGPLGKFLLRLPLTAAAEYPNAAAAAAASERILKEGVLQAKRQIERLNAGALRS